MTRTIDHGQYGLRHPWPSTVPVQGGSHGLVIRRDGPSYGTAFVEATPIGTFLRGEGATIAEAEDACWEKFQTWVFCDNSRDGSDMRGRWHGPFERRQYTNGAGFCTRCGTWMMQVFEPLPEGPDRRPSLIEALLRTFTAEDDEEASDG